MQTLPKTEVFAGPQLVDLVPSYHRSLRARGLQPRTYEGYAQEVREFAAWLGKQGMPTHAERVTSEHVEAYVTSFTDRGCKNSTASVHFRALQAFFKWAFKEDVVKPNPMANLDPPRVAPTEVPVLSEEELRTLLGVCEGKHFEAIRDTALIRFFVDTGCRLTEVTNLQLDDLDLDSDLVTVLGKGGKVRRLHLGEKTVEALDRYLRLRHRHPRRRETALWVGPKGALTANGIRQMIRRRARAAGLEHLHPHQLRHTYAHHWLAAGGSETGLMKNAGWSSRSMVQRYASSTAAERAREEHRRLRLGDRL